MEYQGNITSKVNDSQMNEPKEKGGCKPSAPVDCSAINNSIDAAEDAINYAKGHLARNDPEAAILSIKTAIQESNIVLIEIRRTID